MSKKTKIIRAVIAAAVFVIIAVLLLVFLQALLMPKYMDEIQEGAMIAEYYDSEPQHSVLFFGDCEFYNAINPAVIWEEYGIPTYVRGSAQQLIWHSYYLMLESFEYEKPDIVVFNAVEMKIGKVQNEAYTRMTLDGMPLSKYKIEAVRESLTDGESFHSYIFPILRYHSRWNEIGEEDFRYLFKRDKVTFNGYMMTTGTQPWDKLKTRDDHRIPADIPDNCWLWLDRIREACDENGVTLIVLKSPTDTAVYPWYPVWDDKLSEYCSKHGVRYLNAIKEAEAIGTDWNTDSCDGGDHLNYLGAEKLSRWLGKIFSEEYKLSDRRGDPKLSAEWNETLEKYKAAVKDAEK